MTRFINETALRDYLDQSFYFFDLPGLAVAVGYGEDEFRYATGWQNALTRTPLTLDQIFHFASVSKTLVGTAILQLAEAGVLTLDEKLVHYLPDFRMADPNYTEITLRQLLSHTSGMPDVIDYGWDRPETDSAALERYVFSPEVTQAHLLWPPGANRFTYSNIAYEILGLVVARLSGLPFETYIARHIFEPAGMQRASMLTFERDMAEVAAPHYKTTEHRFALCPHFPYNRAHAPSSTLTGEIADLIRWARSNLDETLLESASYQAARQTQALVPNNGEHICLSWFSREQAGYTLYGHEGTDDGFRSSFWFCPELNYYSIVCSNLSAAPVKKIAKELFRLTVED